MILVFIFPSRAAASFSDGTRRSRAILVLRGGRRSVGLLREPSVVRLRGGEAVLELSAELSRHFFSPARFSF